MERGRYGGRGFIKNPPQPHMCIQDSLVGSVEPCFVNILSWEKILMPAHPSDVIPLFGGMKIKNSSLNSLSCTDLYEGVKDGKQPLIFAVCTNTTILKQNGKAAEDPNGRDAFICIILDFIEAMNIDVRFQHNFKILPDRDVVGELKDIWFIIQSKRDQERIELSCAENERNSSGKLKNPTNGHWYYKDSNGERKLLITKDLRSEQNAIKLLNSPHAISSKSAKEISDFFTSASGTKSKHVAGGKCFPLSHNFQSPAMKEAISWSKQSYPTSQVASMNYDAPSTSHSLKHVSLKPLPPSFNESIQMKSREGKSAAMNQRNKTETTGPIYHIRNEDKILFPPFPSSEYVCKLCFAAGYSTPSKECLQCASVDNNEQNTYESELAMCNQLWQGITTEFLPSLDLGRSKSKVGVFHQVTSKSTPTTKPNATFISNILVKGDLHTDKTELSGNAGLGDVSDQILDIQESSLVQELSSLGSLSIIENNYDTNTLGIVDTRSLTTSPNISTNNLQDKDTTFEYGTDYLQEPLKSNQNIPSFKAVFGKQMNTHLADEANRNVDFLEHNTEEPTKSDLLQNIDHLTKKPQKDSNENVNA